MGRAGGFRGEIVTGGVTKWRVGVWQVDGEGNRPWNRGIERRRGIASLCPYSHRAGCGKEEKRVALIELMCYYGEWEGKKMTDSPQTIELFEYYCCVCYGWIDQTKGGRLRRTCSARCRQKLYRMRKGQPDKPAHERRETAPAMATWKPGSCPVCGEPIPQPKQGRKRKTCSQSCRMKLWRLENPRCIVCRKRYTRTPNQKVHLYCSKSCKRTMQQMRRRQRAREREWAKLASYRPDWWPRPGSGYREEAIPWEGDEEEAVVREREPEPRYDEPTKTREEELAERAAAEAARWAEVRAENERKRKAQELARELLEDDTKWWRW